MYNIGHNKCKELLPPKLQFNFYKNPHGLKSWMLFSTNVREDWQSIIDEPVEIGKNRLK
jgi:hypothetical protein